MEAEAKLLVSAPFQHFVDDPEELFKSHLFCIIAIWKEEIDNLLRKTYTPVTVMNDILKIFLSKLQHEVVLVRDVLVLRQLPY